MNNDPERQARFVELIEAHQAPIRKITAIYARDRADRDDLFQEIVLQLWRSFDSFRGESTFSTFLYRVALNTALLRVRKAERSPATGVDGALEETSAPIHRHEDEQVERLYAAIRRLHPIDRAIVLLVLDGQNHTEIAAVTGLSAGNVSVRLARGKERLRELLGAGDSTPKEKPCSTKS